MKTDGILREYVSSQKKIKLLKAELYQLEQMQKIKPTVYSDEPHGSQRPSVYDRYEKYMEKKEKVKLEIAEEELRIRLVETTLELLRETHVLEHNVLTMRYIKNKNTHYIAFELGYAERTVRKKLQNARELFERIYANKL